MPSNISETGNTGHVNTTTYTRGEGKTHEDNRSGAIINNSPGKRETSTPKAELTPLVKPAPPKEPKRKKIVYNMPNTMTPAQLADKFHTTWARISELNGGINANAVPEGYPLQIEMLTDEQYEQYQQRLDAYKSECDRIDELVRKTEIAQTQIERAKEYGLDAEGYNFIIDDKTRDVIIVVNDKKKMSDVREQFGMPKGYLAQNNNFKAKYPDAESYDNIATEIGEKLTVEPHYFNPRQSLWQGLKSMFGF